MVAPGRNSPLRQSSTSRVASVTIRFMSSRRVVWLTTVATTMQSDRSTSSSRLRAAVIVAIAGKAIPITLHKGRAK